jgi:hypothetical protein
MRKVFHCLESIVAYTWIIVWQVFLHHQSNRHHRPINKFSLHLGCFAECIHNKLTNRFERKFLHNQFNAGFGMLYIIQQASPEVKNKAEELNPLAEEPNPLNECGI